jgi:hypothetical protein
VGLNLHRNLRVPGATQYDGKIGEAQEKARYFRLESVLLHLEWTLVADQDDRVCTFLTRDFETAKAEDFVAVLAF